MDSVTQTSSGRQFQRRAELGGHSRMMKKSDGLDVFGHHVSTLQNSLKNEPWFGLNQGSSFKPENVKLAKLALHVQMFQIVSAHPCVALFQLPRRRSHLSQSSVALPPSQWPLDIWLTLAEIIPFSNH